MTKTLLQAGGLACALILAQGPAWACPPAAPAKPAATVEGNLAGKPKPQPEQFKTPIGSPADEVSKGKAEDARPNKAQPPARS